MYPRVVSDSAKLMMVTLPTSMMVLSSCRCVMMSEDLFRKSANRSDSSKKSKIDDLRTSRGAVVVVVVVGIGEVSGEGGGNFSSIGNAEVEENAAEIDE
jgi:hypothetical protein